MFNRLVRNNKKCAAAMSVILVACAFEPVTCTMNVDPALVSSVLDQLSSFADTVGAGGTGGSPLGADGPAATGGTFHFTDRGPNFNGPGHHDGGGDDDAADSSAGNTPSAG